MPKYSVIGRRNGARPHKTVGRANTQFLGSASYKKMARQVAAAIPKMPAKTPAFQIT